MKKGILQKGLWLILLSSLTGCSVLGGPLNRQWDGNQDPVLALAAADKKAARLTSWHSVRISNGVQGAQTEVPGRRESWAALDDQGRLCVYSRFDDHTVSIARYEIQGLNPENLTENRLPAPSALAVCLDENRMILSIEARNLVLTPELPFIPPALIEASREYTVLENTPSCFALMFKSAVHENGTLQESETQFMLNADGLLQDMRTTAKNAEALESLQLVFDQFDSSALNVREVNAFLDQAANGLLRQDQRVVTDFFAHE